MIGKVKLVDLLRELHLETNALFDSKDLRSIKKLLIKTFPEADGSFAELNWCNNTNKIKAFLRVCQSSIPIIPIEFKYIYDLAIFYGLIDSSFKIISNDGIAYAATAINNDQDICVYLSNILSVKNHPLLSWTIENTDGPPIFYTVDTSVPDILNHALFLADLGVIDPQSLWKVKERSIYHVRVTDFGIRVYHNYLDNALLSDIPLADINGTSNEEILVSSTETGFGFSKKKTVVKYTKGKQ